MRPICISIMVFLYLLGSAIPGRSQSFNYIENSVYVYNFIKYTEWPQKKSVIQVGIVGVTPLEEELRKLFSKKANSKVSYSVKKINASEAKNVDVVIVARNEPGKVRTVDEQTAHAPVLIISEKEDMGRAGACISFFIDEDNDYKTGYQLSIRNCKARGLSVSEEILNNAVLTR